MTAASAATRVPTFAEEDGAYMIMVVEDDPTDWDLMEESFNDAQLAHEVKRLHDGVELLEYLGDPSNEKPGLILLDLNMPRLNGFETLVALRSDPNLRHLVVVIMTTSKSSIDIFKGYHLGANSYIVKPLSFKDMTKAIKTLESYWINLVVLPPNP
jgi:CheY-like chemotaxis protein